jgi:hypothetical protein
VRHEKWSVLGRDGRADEKLQACGESVRFSYDLYSIEIKKVVIDYDNFMTTSSR